jgi:hypothetical protein
MSALLPHEIEAFLADDNKKRNGELHKGYQIALDSADFVRQQKNNVRALKESMDNAQVDQLESEGEEGGEGDEDGAAVVKKSKGSTSKKRKRDSEVEPAKAKRGPKTTKKDSVEPVKKKSAPGKTARKNGAKSKALVESEDEGAEAEDDDDDDAGPSKKTSPPPAKKAKRDKEDADYGVFFSLGSVLFFDATWRTFWNTNLLFSLFFYIIRANCVLFYFSAKGSNDPQSLKVRDWRHKLQKTFLSNKTLPKAEVCQPICPFGCHTYPTRAECTRN